MVERWMSGAEIAAAKLPGLPQTARGIALYAEQRGWASPEREGVLWRKRAGKGGGAEFSTRLLPASAQAHLLLKAAPALIPTAASAPASSMGASERWSWFERQPETKKQRARDRLQALQVVTALIQSGSGKVYAMQLAAQNCGVALSTLYEWDALVQDVPRPDWLPHLCPVHGGGRASAECSPEAWDALRADYLRASSPNFTACYRRVAAMAAEKGWTLPPERTLHRRMMAIPEAQRVLARKGADALLRMFPAQQRDRGVFHALEAVNADGHVWDVFVKWPDGTIGRPHMVAFQDLYSGKILSWRVDQALSWHGVRLAFGDVVEQFGIPSHCWLDNGREFASKRITGGQATRYRFKVKDEEPEGLMTALGVEVHWTTPYHGQAKPIERAFRDFAQDIAKHPAFEGAYTGNSPTNKPHNYGTNAVPLDTFLQVIGAGIAEHNARTGRKGGTAAGRSFDQVFAESYERSPIRKAAPEQRRLWLLAAEAVRVRKQDGQIHLWGNRYWSEFLHAQLGATVTVRFDPDALAEPLHVYSTDNRYLGAAEPQEMAGFNSVAAAQAQARRVKQFRRGTREALDAQRRMSLADLVRDLPKLEVPEPPEAKIVMPFRGNTALQPVPSAAAEEDTDAVIEGLARFSAASGAHLRLIEED